MNDAIEDLAAIDVHAHYGIYDRGEENRLVNEFMSGEAATVAARAERAHVEWTVVSPLLGLLPRGGADAAAGNREAARVVEETPGLLQWVVVNPLQPETYEQARQRLASPRCVGIKIHPEEHVFPIRDHGQALFAFAADHAAVVLVHSGNRNSLPADFLPFADAHPEVKLILAHIGNTENLYAYDFQVRAVQAAKHGNVFADTSSARSMVSGLIEWAAAEAGPERILFGTDSPLYSTAAQRARIDHAEIPDHHKRLILRENAARLLDLPG